MLKIEQIELIKRKFYVGSSTGRISEFSLMRLSVTVKANLVKRRREVYSMISLQKSLIWFANKDPKTYHGIACVRRLRELRKSIN